MSDRYLAIENARYIFNNLRNLSDEIVFKEDGIIQERASRVLDEAVDLLKEIQSVGLFETLEKGTFANIKRSLHGGKGLEGVEKKGNSYRNPFIEKMLGGSYDG
jgi:beta-lysine 5,6-aminomutase alpha subunit